MHEARPRAGHCDTLGPLRCLSRGAMSPLGDTRSPGSRGEKDKSHSSHLASKKSKKSKKAQLAPGRAGGCRNFLLCFSPGFSPVLANGFGGRGKVSTAQLLGDTEQPHQSHSSRVTGDITQGIWDGGQMLQTPDWDSIHETESYCPEPQQRVWMIFGASFPSLTSANYPKNTEKQSQVFQKIPSFHNPIMLNSGIYY